MRIGSALLFLSSIYVLSPGWLKIDPTFDPLRGNRRFERLLGGGK